MGKHKSDDYKLSAVKYYLKVKNFDETCKIFNCSHRSLKRWVEKYIKCHNVKNKDRKEGSYKIKQKHIDMIKKIIKKYPDIYLWEIHELLQLKFDDYDISWQHLHDVIRDNNLTRKRLSQQHFPKITRGKERDEKKEVKHFFKKISKYKLSDIISIDETSIKGGLMVNYGRSELGKKCIYKTTDNKVYTKYTFVSAITTKGTIGFILYEKGGMAGERFVKFLDKILDGKKNKLIVIDNGGMHKTQQVKDKILNSGNNYLYIVSYKHYLNAIEEYFNQLKHYIKLDKPLTYKEIKESIKNSLSKIKKEHYKNYFLHAYNISRLRKERKKSNRRRENKIYKT